MSISEVGVYTVEDLHAYREQRRDMTVQLIEGELVVSPSPSLVHQVLHSRLFGILLAAAPEQLLVLSAPLDVRAGERTVVQPDLLVVEGSQREGSEVTVPPVLAVEILSPSSRGTDLVRKPELLARFGCQHYWVLDPLHPAIRQFRLVRGTSATGTSAMGTSATGTSATGTSATGTSATGTSATGTSATGLSETGYATGISETGTYESGRVVEGEDLFETDEPFHVRFRPADLTR